jgi:hypothetical protein
MDRLDDCVGRSRKEAVDEVRAGDWLGLRAAVAFELGPYACKGGQGAFVGQREPTTSFFPVSGFGRRGVFCEAVEWHEPVFRLQPASPVRRCCIADIGDRRAARSRWRRHIPAHHGQLALLASISHDGRWIVRELPNDVRAAGYQLQENGEGERILPSAIVQRFTRNAAGEFEPMTAGSTRVVALPIGMPVFPRSSGISGAVD